ncbi:MAG: TetR/AcrR family transcriptional regulator [Coprobacillus sp.]|nr:TetR/AcrR family transcriptional regulator [Coprobacillus sp.]
MPKSLEEFEKIREKSKSDFLEEGLIEYASFLNKRVTVSSISKGVGASRTLFYHYFKDLNEFFIQVINLYILPLEEKISDLIKKSSNPKFALYDLFDYVEAEINHSDEIYKVFLELNLSLNVYSKEKISQKYCNFLRKNIAKILRDGIDLGLFNPVDIEETTNLYLSVFRAMVLNNLTKSTKKTPTIDLNSLLNMVIKN